MQLSNDQDSDCEFYVRLSNDQDSDSEFYVADNDGIYVHGRESEPLFIPIPQKVEGSYKYYVPFSKGNLRGTTERYSYFDDLCIPFYASSEDDDNSEDYVSESESESGLSFSENYPRGLFPFAKPL